MDQDGRAGAGAWSPGADGRVASVEGQGRLLPCAACSDREAGRCSSTGVRCPKQLRLVGQIGQIERARVVLKQLRLVGQIGQIERARVVICDGTGSYCPIPICMITFGPEWSAAIQCSKQRFVFFTSELAMKLIQKSLVQNLWWTGLENTVLHYQLARRAARSVVRFLASRWLE